MKITYLYTGYCKNFQKAVLKTGRWKLAQFPALCILIEHPVHGKILFDTGYSKHLFEETKHLPFALYRYLTPITFDDKDSAAYQLSLKGIKAEEIDFIVISHFHADHIAGLKDFPNAKFIYHPQAYDSVRNLTGFSALHAAFIPGLLPKNFVERSLPLKINQKVKIPFQQFPEGFDIFNDRSIIGIELPGHAFGQIGIILKNGNDQMLFFVADASWTSAAIRENTLPNWLGNLVLADKPSFQKTLNALHNFHKQYPEIKLCPTHCEEVFSFLHMSNSLKYFPH